jgi:hypothetical protein
VPAGEVAGLAHDARAEVGIEQEVLAESAARRKPVPSDDLTQRREAGQRRAQE